MSNDTSSDQPRSSFGRKLGVIAVVLLVLLVIAYFVISSSAFLKSVVLPQVAKSLKADVTVADASLSPFSQLTLDKLKIQAPGQDPVLTAEQVRVRYSLFSILGGNYVIHEIAVASPVLQIVKQPNGSSNLDPLTKGQGQGGGSKSTGPLRLALEKLAVTDGSVRTIAKGTDGSTTSAELSQLNVTAEHIGNGQTGKLNLGTAMKMDRRIQPGQPGTNDLLEAKVNGTFDFKLDPNLLPQSITGNAALAVGKGEGSYADVGGLAGTLQVDMTPTEVRQLALRFERGGRGLGRITATGPLELAKSEGRLRLEIQSIDRQVLNLVGASRGWDFADSQMNATNYVDLARQGEVIGAKGQIAGRQMSVHQQGQASPPLDLDVDYDITLNRNEQSAVIKKLTINGQQQGKRVIQAALSDNKPMTLSWAANAKGFTESTFQLLLSDLTLQDWRMFTGTNLPTGRLSGKLDLTAREDGKLMSNVVNIAIQDLATRIGSNQIAQAQLNLSLESKVQNFRTIDLTQYRLEVQQAGQALLKASGTAHYDLSKPDLALQTSAEVALPALLRVFPSPDVVVSNGAVRLSAAVSQNNQKYSATGNVFLGDFTGRYGSYVFRDYQTALDYDVAWEKPALQIRSASLTMRQGYSSGGNVALTGDYDQQKQAAHGTVRLVDLNENALRPFLNPMLGSNTLSSISISGSAACNYDPKGETALKTDLAVTNWVVTAPQPGATAPKLAAQVQLDGSLRQQLVELRQCLLKLTPTARAKNELQVTGRIDMGKTNATPSQITVASDSLDLTPYYEMFSSKPDGSSSGSKPATAQGSPASAASASAPGTVPGEPAAVSLPIEQLTADIKLGRLYLRELAITNLQTTAKIKRGEVNLNPCELNLNGAPVSANAQLNLGVPGYIYDVTMKADHVPMEPLVNSFSTNAPGSIKGDLVFQAHIQGAGMTGRNLQKNLAGNLALNLTNMSYEIVGPKIKRVLQPISLALRVPELMLTPLNWVGAKSEMGKGQIDLQQFVVESQAFHAESHGVVPIADVLTNSPLNLPVALALRRNLADKAGLLPANTPTNTVYASLPTFVTLKGTVGDPRTDINKLVVGGLLARSIGGIVPVGDKASNVLQGVGNLLSGQTGATTGTNSAAASTNAAANLVEGIAGLFNQPKKDKAATTAPAAAPASTPATAPTRATSSVSPARTNTPPATATNKTTKPSTQTLPNK